MCSFSLRFVPNAMIMIYKVHVSGCTILSMLLGAHSNAVSVAMFLQGRYASCETTTRGA